MQYVVIAGGKGTRLRERIGDLPKPLAVVGGQPLLEHHILLARKYGITNVLLLTGHGADRIREFCADGSRWGVRIRYSYEVQPLGTAGAVLQAWPLLDETFIVAYSDTMLNVDLARFLIAHESREVAATLFVHPNDHPHDSDLIEADESGRIVAFHSYPHPEGQYFKNSVNAALYIVRRDSLEPWRARVGIADFGKHLFPSMLADGMPLRAYSSSEYIKDAGTPERLDRVLADYESGRIARGSFATPAPAVFFDRDGTLNREVGRITAAEQLEVLEGVPEAVELLNHSGYRAIVVTNQPVVARGDCDELGLKRIHNKLETLLGYKRAYLDAIYHCPHHPDRGFAGERPELKFDCDCRKPKTGMIERAARELNVDLSRSWLVGDMSIDIRTAKTMGIRSILVRTGYAGQDGLYPDKPDQTFDTVLDAVRYILASRGEHR